MDSIFSKKEQRFIFIILCVLFLISLPLVIPLVSLISDLIDRIVNHTNFDYSFERLSFAILIILSPIFMSIIFYLCSKTKNKKLACFYITLFFIYQLFLIQHLFGGIVFFVSVLNAFH
jgi:uncharacterized BrkB/YihY/UPF0761 family membrane protein